VTIEVTLAWSHAGLAFHVARRTRIFHEHHSQCWLDANEAGDPIYHTENYGYAVLRYGLQPRMSF